MNPYLEKRLPSPNPLVSAARLLSPNVRLSPASSEPLDLLFFGDTIALKSEWPVISLRSSPGLSSSRACGGKPLFRNCLAGVYRVPSGGEYSAAGVSACER